MSLAECNERLRLHNAMMPALGAFQLDSQTASSGIVQRGAITLALRNNVKPGLIASHFIDRT
jgi:hypothetical protein